MSRSVSIIIVTWNALKHLKTFLPSVTETDYEDFEIILADNASTDGSAEWVRKNYPECSIVTYPRNYGYCGGNNRAADYARGEILVFLNNDVQVRQDWLQPLVKQFDDPNIAAVQPKIRSFQYPDYFEYAGAAGGFLDSMGYSFCRGRVFDTIEKDKGQYDDTVRIFWASGAALAVRKEVFTESGRFDDDFQFHMEEIDLCWRILNKGYRIIYCPESVVYHLGGGSLPMSSSRKTYFNFRNSLTMLWKNATPEWLKRRFFLRLCLDGAAGIYALSKGNISDTRAIIKAHFHFYRHWKQTHDKRRSLQLLRTVERDPAEMIRSVIITDYFLFSKKWFHEIAKNKTL